MEKIAVLLSSYNGDDYIEEQIESIYRQSCKDFQLYIRDDGSDEAFKNQLRALRNKYGFVLYEGDNIGFVGSFMWLLRNVKEAEYYAFADQDDIWKEGKLEKAIKWFEDGLKTGKVKQNRPALFHSAYEIALDIAGTDSNDSGIAASENNKNTIFFFPDKGYDFRRSITENHYSGFSMMINKPLRNLMIRGNDNKIGYHDWWAAMIVQAFGTAHSDENVMAVHRAHGDNVTTFNLFTRVRWLISSLKEEADIHKRSVEFDRCFGDRLRSRDKMLLDMFSYNKYNIIYAFRKCFYPKRWRPVVSSEIVVRLLMLIGRI